MALRVHRAAVIGATALLTVASAALLLWQQRTEPVLVSGDTVALDGLTTEIQEVGWIDFDMGHVMDGQGGFMMPDQMMPGAPTGDDVRLGITLTLSNTSDATRQFNVFEEFSVVDEAGTEWTLTADTIGLLSRLGPETTVRGILYFDIAVSKDNREPALYLQWRRHDDLIRMALSLTGEAPEHKH